MPKSIAYHSQKTFILHHVATKLVGHLASLFLGQVASCSADGDDAGRVRRDALLGTYAGYESAILMLDDVIRRNLTKLKSKIFLAKT